MTPTTFTDETGRKWKVIMENLTFTSGSNINPKPKPNVVLEPMEITETWVPLKDAISHANWHVQLLGKPDQCVPGANEFPRRRELPIQEEP